MAKKMANQAPVRFLWEQSVDEPETVLLVRVQGNWDHVAAVWRQDNGKWRFSVYRPNPISPTKGYSIFTQAQVACVDEVKRQYREIQAALQKMTFGPTVKT